MGRTGRSMALVGLLTATLGIGTLSAQSAAADASGGQGGGERGGERGAFAGMAHAMGEVTAVAGNTLTLKTETGSVMQVVATDNTRVTKDRATVKVTDLHPGDGLMALGLLDAPNKTLHAAMIFAQDAAEVKAMKENLGKTYITGRVTAVDLDNAKATVERADHVSQTIGFDESTSFKRAVRGGNGGNGPAGGSPTGIAQGSNGGEGQATSHEGGRGRAGGFGGGMGMGVAAMGAGFDRAFSNGESITLADIKVGDFLSGTGAVKNNIFIPNRVVDSPPRPHRPRTGEAPPAAGTATSATSTPGER